VVAPRAKEDERMKAITMNRSGGPEVLHVDEVPTPVLTAASDVLVRLRAAGLNPIDMKVRRDTSRFPLHLPAVPGFDGAGVIEQVGNEVTRFRNGDAVYFCHPGFGGHTGTYAEYALVPEHLLARKPESLDFRQAAAIPLALITAWESLFERARLSAGHSVLIHAGAGGVGHLAIQLAHQAGARVCTTVSTPEKAELAQALGADWCILYRDEDITVQVMDWTGGQGVDIALDTVGDGTFTDSFATVRYGGDLVTLLQPPAGTDWGIARKRNLRISLELMLSPLMLGLLDAQRAQAAILERCAPRFDNGELRVVVAEYFPFDRAAQAHERLEAGSLSGKLVLDIG
jgi:NADPH2:quinone reductase